ncbi:superoxide dismutase [Anaeramoeba flamelloides]|uniref:Superoxide dismutase n=1 Tax=Anaeramoeba flamelloides TaxID=1746091 RepID=A0AAV7Y720_9EUKA|nr:superoxide dismutase [Anaeramoeba flamelloides]KAJ6227865.1 superoxide dismutase [Anaeramoeba flamelloides]
MHKLPKLPFPIEKGIKPAISGRTLGFHFGKHHAGYVNKLNKAIKGTKFENTPLTQVIKETFDNEQTKGIFNNSSQHFNHSFYWNCMKPNGSTPSYKVKKVLEKSFGSFENFVTQFKQKAGTLFGSGWCWLVADGQNLEIIQTSNAMNPLPLNKKPLLVIDVWEHAYYLDYQNNRGESINKFFDVINWDFVEKKMIEAGL